MEKVKILGINITNLRAEDLNNQVKKIIDLNKKELVLNVNVNCMNLAVKNNWLKVMLNNAYINFCDGDGVILGAKLQGKKIAEKITYNRWIWKFAEFSEKNNLSWYWIGTRSEIISKANEIICKRYPNLKILGIRNGFFKDEADINMTISDINEKKPNILILGLGMPLQEKWLFNYWDKINCNVALTGGAVFDYISGYQKMTPDIFYSFKLEWFFRFLCEPSRLFKRYFIGNLLFIFRVLLEKYHLIDYN